MTAAKSRPAAFWHGTSGVRKARLVSRHLSNSFVSKHYTVVHTVAWGSFGRIDLVRERGSGQLRVCKVIDIADMHPAVLRMMRNEVQVLSALDHPHIVKLYEFAEDEKHQQLVMVLEYVEGSDCLELLREYNRVLPEKLVARIVKQVLVALSYCHSQGITHRDIKPENVMLTSENLATCDSKVIDFGLATPCKGDVKEFAGTASYLAPEVAIKEAGFSPAADVWALAATAFELLAGTSAFVKPADGDFSQVLDRLCNYRHFGELEEALRSSPGFTSSFRSEEAVDFLRYLMIKDPEARPTAPEALGHPWLQMHQVPSQHLQADLITSFVAYSRAPPLLRDCLFAVAARGTELQDELSRLSRAFLEADCDQDGKVSKEDLKAALGKARGWLSPEVDLDAVFTAADTDRSGRINHSDFLAVGLYPAFGGLTEPLLDMAFRAMDHDRDGQVFIEDVKKVFHRLPPELQKMGSVTLKEWRSALLPKPVASGDFFSILSGLFGCREVQGEQVAELDTVQLPTMLEDKVALPRLLTPARRKGPLPTSRGFSGSPDSLAPRHGISFGTASTATSLQVSQSFQVGKSFNPVQSFQLGHSFQAGHSFQLGQSFPTPPSYHQLPLPPAIYSGSVQLRPQQQTVYFQA